jgi:hypothetical protein
MITINGQTYKLKTGFRALMMFEEVTGKNAYLASTSLTDSVLMFYSIVKSSNPEFPFSKDQFIDLLDEQPELLEQFNAFADSLITDRIETAAVKKKVERRSQSKTPMP